MNWLLARRCLLLINWLRRLWFATGLDYVETARFVLMLLIMTMCVIQLSAKVMCLFLPLSPAIKISKIKLAKSTVELILASVGLLYIIHIQKCKLASLISLGTMFTFTSYLVLLCLRFWEYHKKTGIRRCNVSSCVWTRRKVL